MDETNSQELPYPEINDPAADALQLQVLAEAIDAKLVAKFAEIRTVLNPVAALVNLSVTQTGIPSSETPNTVFFDQIVYQSGSWGLAPTYLFFPETGYYRIGAYTVTTASGAFTLNSRVEMTLNYPYIQAFPFTTVTTEYYTSQNFQSGSTASEHQVAEALVRCDVVNTLPSGLSPLNYSGISTTIVSSNVASTLNVIAGSKMWAYKVSELED